MKLKPILLETKERSQIGEFIITETTTNELKSGIKVQEAYNCPDGEADITIPEEKLYTKEEVEYLINKYRIFSWELGSTIQVMNTWIKENLK